MHGIARVLVKGYGERRVGELSRRRREFEPARVPDGSGWRALATEMESMGMVVHRGQPPDGPVH